ncbi:ABC transporter permease subunit, partial [Bacillus sp. JJ722]|uniref:ABC transporter permease subunit n=1 Tax=Bacillus sp. JJ722 TaxID=3122973 RepID=UPI002FFDC11A
IKMISYVKSIRNTILAGIIIVLSVCFIAALPSLIFTHRGLDGLTAEVGKGFYPSTFFEVFLHTLTEVLTPLDVNLTLLSGTVPFFSFIQGKFVYSMSILFTSIIVTVISSFALAYFYSILSMNTRKWFSNALTLTEAIPDIVIIFSFQFVIITIYKTTGIKFFQLYGLNSNVYLLPIVCLSLVPIFLLTRTLITILNEEEDKLYVEFAKAKGLSKMEVFFHHILSNVIYSFSQHFTIVYWYMLSSLFIIEYLFMLKGFTSIFYEISQPEIVAISMVMLMLPYVICLQIIKLIQYILVGRVVTNEE